MQAPVFLSVAAVRLRRWMIGRKLTQEQAAELLEISQSYLSKLLRSGKPPGSPDVLVRIDRVCGIKTSEWIKDSAVPVPPPARLRRAA